MSIPVKISPLKAIGMFILVALFLFYEMGIQVYPGIITDELIRDLHVNALTLGLLSGFYYYTYTLMQIPAGLLYDRFNIRLVIVLPLLICAIGTALFGISQTFIEASFARLFMGAGSAFAFIGVLVVAADVFPRKHFALLAGLAQMLAALGAMGGEYPLAALVNAVGWRHTLFILALAGVVLAILIWLFVRYRQVQTTVVCKEKQQPIFHSLKLILQNRQTWFVALYACMLWAPMAAFASLWGVPYLRVAYGISHNSAAGLVSLMWLGIALASPLVGWWSDHIIKRKAPLIFCAAIGFIGFTVILFSKAIPQWSLGLFMLLAGAACAGQALSFALVRDNNKSENRAAAIGFNNMAVVIAGALFQPLVGKLIQLHWDGSLLNGIPTYSASDYEVGLFILPICYLIALLTGIFLLRESRCCGN